MANEKKQEAKETKPALPKIGEEAYYWVAEARPQGGFELRERAAWIIGYAANSNFQVKDMAMTLMVAEPKGAYRGVRILDAVMFSPEKKEGRWTYRE